MKSLHASRTDAETPSAWHASTQRLVGMLSLLSPQMVAPSLPPFLQSLGLGIQSMRPQVAGQL